MKKSTTLSAFAALLCPAHKKSYSKILYYIVILCAGLCSAAVAQNWTPLVSATTKTLEAVYAFSPDTVICVGDSGTILRTTNGGASWNNLSLPTTQYLEGVTFPSDTGYIVARNGDVYKSYDRGVSWSSQYSALLCKGLDIHFTTNENGYIAGNDCGGSQLWCTTNGGANWTGYSGGSEIFYSVFGLSDNNIVAVGRPGNATKGGTCACGVSCWATSAPLTGPGDTNYAVYFSNPSLGIIVGDSGRINKTVDGGASWTLQSSGTSMRLYSVSFYSSSFGYIVGKNGTILKTDNQGSQWFADASPTSFDLKDVFFVKSTGYAVGANGTILKINQPVCDGIISTDTIALILHDGINCIDYPIVKIGSQWWMKENVNATLYSDSTSLTDGTSAVDITGDYTTKYFFNYANNPANSDVYGKLYTWAAAMNGAASSDSIPSGVQGVCPTGWHLPGDSEWKQLELYLGMTQAEVDATQWRGDKGHQLKETGPSHWSGNCGTNTTGLTALPDGYRGNNGSFSYLTTYGYLWTATEVSGTNAWLRNLACNNVGICRVDNWSGKEFGVSVRCVKDITPLQPLTASISNVTNVTCNGASDGSATVTVTGGTTPYTYSWTGGQTTSTAIGLAAGTYGVTVTDANSNSAIDSVTITEPPALNISPSSVNPACFGVCNGSATAFPSGGTSPYTYAWSGGGASSTKTGLCAGTYTVTVTDNKGCTSTTSITLTQPTAVTVTVTPVAESCDAACNGSVTASASGGTGPFTYSWCCALGSGATKSGLCDGTYIVTVTDANGCTITASGTVTQPAALTVSTSQTDVSCNSGSNGQATATPGGGTSPYTYVWNDPAPAQSTQTVTGLTAGTWSVTVTDNKGCTVTASVTITQPAASLSVSNSVTNLNCNGVCTGSITANGAGGTGSYTYNWSNGMNGATISSLCAGNYIVTIADANGCTSTATGNVTGPSPLIVTANSTDETCNGFCNGSATATSVGGTSPFTFAWSQGGTNSNITGLCAGSYTVTSTDANSCTVSQSVTVGSSSINSSAPTGVNANPGTTICSGASVTLTQTGGALGTGASYYWYSGSCGGTFIGSGVSLSVSPGSTTTYYVRAQGTCNTTACASVTITVNTTSSAATSASAAPNPTCGGATTLTANVGSLGTGASWYWYSSGCGGTFVGNGVNLVVSPGSTTTYYVRAEGSCNTTACASVTLTVITDYDTSVSVSICSGDSIFLGGSWQSVGGTYYDTLTSVNGCDSVIATTLIVNNPYNTPASAAICLGDSIFLQNNYQTIGGTYYDTLASKDGCDSVIATTLIVNQAPAIISWVVDAATQGNSDGAINITVTGGTGSYTFFWSPGGYITEDISNIVAGTYSVTVTDSSGCFTFQSFTVPENPNPCIGLTLNILATSAASCAAICDGDGAVYATGGTLPYTYLWNDPAFQTSPLAVDLCSATYLVNVTDSAGCTDTTTVIINSEPEMVLEITTINATCDIADGSATISVTNGAAPYKYFWSSGDTLPLADSLPSGIYVATIFDKNGCSAFKIATISDANGPVITNTFSTNITCHGGSDGAIAIIAAGGDQPYTYLWSNGGTAAGISNLVAGPYEIAVTDSSGCVANTSITLTEPFTLDLIITTVSADCGSNNGNATLNVSGGSGGYSYLWSTGGTSPTETGLSAGIYTVTVTDVKGCNDSANAAVSNIGGATITIDSIIGGGCGAATGSIYLTVTGGSGLFSYLWSDGSTAQDLIGVSPGTYSVAVTDTNNCITTAVSLIPGVPSAQASICLVTVDSATGKNLIVWEKSGGKSFNIYRETSEMNKYYLIGNVPYDSLSVFVDSVADSKQRSWRYKISVVDSCGNESVLSPVHKTIHLNINQGIGNNINLIWDYYEGFEPPPSSYYIYRYTTASGWDSLTTLPANLNSFTDDPPQMANLWYQVRVKHPSGCAATLKIKNYNSSISNTQSIIKVGTVDINNEINLKIFPNPTTGVFTLEMELTRPVPIAIGIEIKVLNILGQVIYVEKLRGISGKYKKTINLGAQPKGIYNLQLLTGEGVVNKKVVIQ